MADHTTTTIAVRGCSIQLMRGGTGRAAAVSAWRKRRRRLAAVHGSRSPRRFDVIVPEHPGFGDSDTPDWLDTIHDLAYFYLDFLEQLDLDRVHLVGISLGGWIAAELAVRDTQPARVAHARRRRRHPRARRRRRSTLFLRTDEQRIRDFFHDQARADEMIARLLRPELEDVTMKNRVATAKLAWQPRGLRPASRTSGCTGSTCRR